MPTMERVAHSRLFWVVVVLAIAAVVAVVLIVALSGGGGLHNDTNDPSKSLMVIDSTISQGATFWPNSSMPTIWLAPPNTAPLISVASKTVSPLSTAIAPNNRPNGRTATMMTPSHPSNAPHQPPERFFGLPIARPTKIGAIQKTAMRMSACTTDRS